MKKYRNKFILSWLLIVFILTSTSCDTIDTDSNSKNDYSAISPEQAAVSLEGIPEYTGEPYVELNDNQPSFDEEELTDESYEYYSELDELGRCGAAEAIIGTDLMPTEERGQIGQIKPSGWHTVKYDNIDGKFLYNRCHLIGYQLSGENANERNLITGTRYLNVTGMLPFENEVADYVKETENHVMFRATPIFKEDNLVASGVQLEAQSVEDGGEGVCFNVYIYNVQPGIAIDYAEGESRKSEIPVDRTEDGAEESEFILNMNTRKFHRPDCDSVDDIKTENKGKFMGSKKGLMEQGYEPCKRCNP